ncbi:MAG: amidohydrolase family protein [Candidatus Aminicenantes bacterium]|nr:amidohydrolase family protein [Candidatus Aminicenantes bacterium]
MERAIRILTIVIFLGFLMAPVISRTAELDDTVVLKGATVYTAVGPPVPNAVILIQNGKIAAVGQAVDIPEGVKIIDVTGKQIIPGLFDEHTHVGGYEDVNEFTMPIGPENRAIDALNLDDPNWFESMKAGVTTVVTTPGSGERMGGQSVTIKTWGKDLQKRILKENREAKMAVNARDLSHIPEIRKTFIKAKEYMEKWEKYEAGDKKEPAPDRDFAMEALVPVLKGEEKLRVHIHFANDMMTFLKLKDEFGLDMTFIHSSESYKVADEIAKRKVPVIMLPLATRIAIDEGMLFGIKKLYDAGVKVALHTDHPVVHLKLLRVNAAMAIHYGVPEDAALKMVTLNPAVSSKVSDRVGSIEIGKDADLVVLNGTWYEPRSRVDMVFVDGFITYDRMKDDKYPKEAD